MTLTACIARSLAMALAGLSLAQSPPPGTGAAEFEALLGRLTAPLEPSLVQAAVRHPHVADSARAQGLITHLTAQGGVAAVQGVLGLASHASPEVRAEALRAVAMLGLRVAGAADGARQARRDISSEVEIAAITALGVVGEARDVTELLELLSSADEDKALQVSAFRALRMLTGTRIAHDARAWTYWWKQTTKALGKRLDQAIQLLTDGADEADLIDARRLLNGSAWFDASRLEEAAREWLRSAEPRLRSEALRLVAGARLGDLADDVASVLQHEVEPGVVRNGVECAAKLGISVGRTAGLQPSTKDPELVQAAVRHPHVADSAVAQGLIAHLIAQGGVVAVQGVLVLSSHDSPDVRAAALGAVATLGLRVAGAADRARDALLDARVEVKLAAITALGVVGEAGDMAELLALASSEDERPHATAFHALRTLTGMQLDDDAQAWTHWWSQSSRELGMRLDRALQLVTDGAGEADLVEARRLLEQSAWFNARKLANAARKWLRSAEPRLRREGFRLVAKARLGDLADEVARVLRKEVAPDVVEYGVECAVVLGIPVDSLAALQPSPQPPR